jgi:hypothetical protein
MKGINWEPFTPLGLTVPFNMQSGFNTPDVKK